MKKQTEKQPKQIEFRFVLVKTEKKINVFKDPLMENVWDFFSVCFGLLRENSVCFGCFDTGPKQWNKSKKKFFGFAKQTEKQPKQIEIRFVSVWTEKKLIVSRTLY